MTTDYKYKLQPYSGSATRTICPNCGKKEFSQYIDIETGEIINSAVGRCNRESNCGYHLTPGEYLKDKGSYHCITVSGRYNRYTPIQKTIQLKPDFIPFVEVDQSVELTHQNPATLIKWLGDRFGVEARDRLINDYHLGTSTDGGVILWQIDELDRVHTGQILNHTIKDGQAKREHSKHADWVHSRMKRENYLPDGFNMTQCLFGCHLLTRHHDKPVALTEGQKSALIGSALMPGMIWVATCGKHGLKAKMLAPLKGRRVVVFADADAHNDWIMKLGKISKEVGFTFRMFEGIKRNATDEELKAGFDVADYLLKEFTPQTTEQPAKIIVQPKGTAIVLNRYNSLDYNQQTKPIQCKRVTMENWSAEIETLRSFFDTAKLPTEPMRLDQCSVITDVAKFVDSHFVVVDANNGNPTFYSHLERLQTLKMILESESNKNTA